MLETKDLLKKYKPKKGGEVTAVDHVSLRFPEKGMVFLLGKSGSGKSTMLNLLGGLDSYDGGEIIIKGISSKDFDQQRFDSYRNTYVGFIFQEYNVLEEFNVGANIALALELQGRKASDEEINRILCEVDLDGFGDRNPNELSGGQKQRVAIARALVKNPEIIMADEPTGALDSNTGRQVLDTLKKLSADKLVIVVSHDREYAEQYADRIIELADGKVIRDVEDAGEHDRETEKSLVFRTNTVEIPAGYHLTDEDRVRINEYIDTLGSGLTLALPEHSSRFSDTDQSKIPVQDGSSFKLIKSVLPLKSAFRIGSSSLKHKKFRLVMTILLSVVAFTLFAFVDTFSSYNHVRTCVDSLIDSDINYISVSKETKAGSGMDYWWSHSMRGIKDEDLDTVEQETGIPLVGIYKPQIADLSFFSNIGISEEDRYEFGLSEFSGFAEVTEESLEKMGYSIYAGSLPVSEKEIAISLYAAETFIKNGYIYAEPEKEVRAGMDMTDIEEKKNRKPEKFSDAMYMVNKKLLIGNELYKVTGIIDTKFDSSRYKILAEDSEKLTKAEKVLSYILADEYSCAVECSLTGAVVTAPGTVKKMASEEPDVFYPENGHFYAYNSGDSEDLSIYGNVFARISDVPAEDIIWTDGPLEKLENNEIIIDISEISVYNYKTLAEKKFVSDMDNITQNDLRELNDYLEKSGGLNGSVLIWDADNDADKHQEYDNIKIVGCLKSGSRYNVPGSVIIVSDELLSRLVKVTDGLYDCAVGPMPQNRTDMERIVSYCYRDDDVKIRYAMNNAVVYELDTFHQIIKVAAKILFWVAVFFAVFASILMANFISVSISYKRSEIGILRAIGSRSNDVFRIFFSESFVIAMIEFVLTSLLCFAGVTVLNSVVRSQTGILITLLHFGVRQIALVLIISVAVAALASFFPVRKAASKKPIDAIRNR